MMNRRLFSLLIAIALLLAALPQAALATTAGDLLLGDNSQSQSVDNNSIYGYGDSSSSSSSVTTADLGIADTSSNVQYPTLQLGSSDGDDGTAYIVFLQNRLIELGYLQDSADGSFGENTQTAVKQFQKNNNLPVTGIADSNTQNRLYQDASTLVAANSGNTVFGSDVTRVQSMLSLWGFLETRVDGTYGEGTAKAIKAFKQYMTSIDPTYGMKATPTPTAKPETVDVMGMPIVEDELLPLSADAEDPMAGDIDEALLEYVDGDKAFPVYRATVQSGAKGAEVWRVQRRLHQLNYLYEPDGSYGALTKYSIMYFQRKMGMKQTGVADEATQRALFSNSAAASEEYVFPYKYCVDVSDQRVYVGQWTGKDYSKLVKTFVCSTGKKETPTPLGTYHAGGKAVNDMWYYMRDSNVYVKFATRIVGGVMFHSVLYNSAKQGPTSTSVHALGTRASHGCIRLSEADAYWIWSHCPTGTTVIIRN